MIMNHSDEENHSEEAESNDENDDFTRIRPQLDNGDEADNKIGYQQEQQQQQQIKPAVSSSAIGYADIISSTSRRSNSGCCDDGGGDDDKDDYCGNDYVSRLKRKMKSQYQNQRARTDNKSSNSNTGENAKKYPAASPKDNFRNGDEDDSGPEYIRDEDDVLLEFQDDAPVNIVNDDVSNLKGDMKNRGNTNNVLPGVYAAKGRALGVNINARRRYGEQQDEETSDTINIDSDVAAEDSTRRTNETSTFEVVAFAVDETNTRTSFIRRDIRRDIINEAVHATEVEPYNEQKDKYLKYAVCCFLALAFIATVVGLSMGPTQEMGTNDEIPSLQPSLRPTADPRPTFQKVKEEGVLRCYTAWAKPLEEELCRAVAVAVVGNHAKIEPIDATTVPWTQKFDSLKNETFDIAVLWSRTMYRDVVLGTTSSVPIYYDGIVFVGNPEFVDCADRMDVYSSECRRVRICTAEGSIDSEVLLDYLPDLNVIPVPYTTLYDNFVNGICNVIADYKYDISKKSLSVEHNYTGPYKIGTNSLTKLPLGLITRDDDPEWSDLVDWVINILLTAEEQNITQSTAKNLIVELPYRSEKLLQMYDIIAAVGNYGEIYQKHMQHIVPRDGLNLLNNGSSGLIYSSLFDGMQKEGPKPSTGSMLDNILKRGYVRCGIFTDRPGFGTFEKDTDRWEGLDADYCYALSASIFNDKDVSEVFMNRTKFIELNNSNSSNAGYVALVNNEVDVVSGAKVRLNNTGEVQELTAARKGFITYSQPYFYCSSNYLDDNNQKQNLNCSNTDEAFSLMTIVRQDDDDDGEDSIKWSQYVFWIVSSTFYAEEKGITQKRAREMPLVNLLGRKFQMMFQSAIATSGSYDEMYTRNIEKLYPRNGTRNELNINPFGPQHYALPLQE